MPRSSSLSYFLLPVLLFFAVASNAAPGASQRSAEMPAGLMDSVQRARHAIRVSDAEGTPEATNYKQQLRVRFEPDGVRVSPREPSVTAAKPLTMQLEAWGRDGAMRDAGGASRTSTGRRVDYAYAGVTEWWKNDTAGLEHGFDVAQRPGGAGPLLLRVGLGEGWTVARHSEGLLFQGANGERLAYTKLAVVDATGRAIEGRLEADSRNFTIAVLDRDAVYPIHVDPLLINLQAVLEGVSEDGEPSANAGISVSVSGDTAVVGAYRDDTAGGVNAGSAYVFVRSGTSWTQQAQLVASDGSAGDLFGVSVSVSGDTAVVGADFDDTAGGTDAGSAYVFVRSGTSWTQQAQLLASDGAVSDLFGFSVSVSGDTAMVGAFRHDTAGGSDAGSAYVFVRSGANWTQQAQLLASDAAEGDRLGHSVAVNGDTAVVGAPEDDTAGGASAGSAYVFVRGGTSWTQQAQLLAGDGAPNDFFGWSVSVSGDTAVVGAFVDDTTGGTDAGSAYVFVRSGTSWTQQTQLLASDGATGDGLGIAVSVSGDTALVGAYLDDTAGGTDTGSAYVFVRSGTSWTQQEQLLATDGAGDAFGLSVSVSGDTAVVGAYQDDTAGGADAGSAYVFVRSGTSWTQQAQLLATDGAAGDRFGWSVSADGDTAVVAATGDDTAGGATGSAYVFVRSGTSWTQQAQLLASDGAASDLFGASVSVSGDTAVVGAQADDTAGGVNAGSAYVFVRSGTSWTQQAQLLASDGAASDGFGISVSVSGDTAVAGAYQHDTAGGANAGSAYVFVRSGTSWTQQTQLLASDGAAGDDFGFAVTVSDDTVVVGAFGDDTAGGTNAGSAYVFARSGTSWTQEAQLLASDGSSGDEFGRSVSVSGDTAVVGAYQNDTAGGADAGSTYVFVRSGTSWTLEAQLLAPDGAVSDLFGLSVSVSGDTVVVGAHLGDTATGVDSGSAYVFLLVTPGITVTPTSGLTTTEAGGTAAFTIVLNSQPTADVTIALSSSDTTEGTVPASVTFTSANYDTPQTITVTGVDDAVVDGAIVYSILTAAATSSDPNYNGINASDVIVTNSDDDAAGVTVNPTSGMTTTEGGGTAAFTIVLNSQPAGDVTIALSSSDTTEGTVPASVTFTSANYATPQTVTITGVDDTVFDGNVAYSIVTAAATSSDPNYDGLDAADASVTNIDDDDVADLAITKTLTSTPPYIAGETLIYAIAVTNAGPASATNVVVTDVLPAGTTFVAATPSQGTCSGTTTVTCALGTLGEGATATIELTIRTSTPGTVTNTASVIADQADGTSNNNVASAEAAIESAAAIPTMSEWMLVALASLLALAAALRMRA